MSPDPETWGAAPGCLCGVTILAIMRGCRGWHGGSLPVACYSRPMCHRGLFMKFLFFCAGNR